MPSPPWPGPGRFSNLAPPPCSSHRVPRYTFGLRHAVDADHIAAIDNVTRKLMQEGKRPSISAFSSPWATRWWSS
ncbi:MAG: hypothetical protein WDO13_17555 [Verrucomicrobiota bacterium]